MRYRNMYHLYPTCFPGKYLQFCLQSLPKRRSTLQQ